MPNRSTHQMMEEIEADIVASCRVCKELLPPSSFTGHRDICTKCEDNDVKISERFWREQ